MREIKFRAWDKKEKKWVHIDTIFFSSEGNIEQYSVTEIQDTPASYCVHKEHLELIQYTGLKDKNGKEIYEGDIVEYKTTDGFDENDLYKEKRTIIYIDGAFSPIYLSTRCLHTDEDKLLICKNIEVIGNIYENPELLKE